MSKPGRYRPYFHDYSAHILRHYLSRELKLEPVSFDDLSDCCKKDITAAEKAIAEMDDYQKFIINECYSPLSSIGMFRIQFEGACEKLGIDENAGWAELTEALYRVAWHRGLIGTPYKKYEHLYESECCS